MKRWTWMVSVGVICLYFLVGCGVGKSGVDSAVDSRTADESKNVPDAAAEQEKMEGSKVEDMGNAKIQEEKGHDMENAAMEIKVRDAEFIASFAENSSAQALKELLKDGPLTIDMSDYGNMEKVGSIGMELPRNDEQIETEPGDIILYQGNSLVIYYDANSWDFTRIGKIDGVTQEELKEALGDGDVEVTFSLEEEGEK